MLSTYPCGLAPAHNDHLFPPLPPLPTKKKSSYTQEIRLRKQLKSITSNLQRVSECPVCLDVIKYPFKCCTSGHGVCTECIKQLKACPTCQAPFTTENVTLPLCLKNLLEAVPRFCRYSENGCEEIVEENDGHETFCGFRPFHCKAPGCDVAVSLCKLMSHIEKSHKYYKSELVVNTTEKSYYCDSGCFTMASEIQKDHTAVYSLNNWFWVAEEINGKKQCIELTYYATPIGKLVDNYFVRVYLKRGQFVYSNILKAYEVSSSIMKGFEDCHSLSSNDNNEEFICKLSIPFKLLKLFAKKDLEFDYYYEFFSVPKEK